MPRPKLSDEDVLLILSCKYERDIMVKEQKILKERLKKITKAIIQLGARSVANKMDLHHSTVTRIYSCETYSHIKYEPEKQS